MTIKKIIMNMINLYAYITLKLSTGLSVRLYQNECFGFATKCYECFKGELPKVFCHKYG